MYVSEKFIDRIFKSENIILLNTVGNILILFLASLFTFGKLKLVRIEDVEFTKIMIDIIGDTSITVFRLPDKLPNAFNAGTRSLYFTTGIVRLVNREELIAVLLHEYGHFKGKHVWKQMGMRAIAGIATGVIVDKFLPPMKDPTGIGRIYAKILGIFINNIIINQLIGRRHEISADSYATVKGYGKYLSSALIKLEKVLRKHVCKGKSKSKCDTIIRNLHMLDAHPTANARIEKMKNITIKSIEQGKLETGRGIISKLKHIFRSEE